MGVLFLCMLKRYKRYTLLNGYIIHDNKWRDIMNWIALKLRKLSTKLYIVFLLMFVTLASVVVTSYIAVDTQRQHLVLTDMLGSQELLTERVTFTLSSIGETGLNNPDSFSDNLDGRLEGIERYYDSVEEMLVGFDIYEFRYTDDNIVKLEFREAFRKEFDYAIDKNLELWKDVRYYIDFLTNSENLANKTAYEDKLEAFKSLNKRVIENAEFVAKICRDEADRKMQLSKSFQYGSIAFALFVLIVLIYLITDNFYNPIIEIRGIFKRMSKGDITERFKRERDDEFKELYDNFNFFLNNLETIFKLEDKIILENDLDTILCYMYEAFGAFIPFRKLIIEYENMQGVHIEKVVHGSDLVSQEEHTTHTLIKHDDVICTGNRIALPIIVEQNNFGTLYFDFVSHEDIEESHVSFIRLLREKVAFAFYKGFFFKNLVAIVTNGLSEMTEARDPETGNHLRRMSLYSHHIAHELLERGTFSEEIDKMFVENILICAPMHDIGKASIPDSILLKPGKLTDNEYEIMKTHASKGYQVLTHIDESFRKFNVDYFEMAAQIALGHQEKYDGTGYPQGVSGNSIALEARICALADVFDALTSKRPYKEAFSLEKSYGIIEESKGSHFDPEVVDAFFAVQDKIEEVYDAYKEI